jgi:DNA-binding response OmpR family regulator
VSERIVIVDDDARLRNRLRSYLEGEGYECVAVSGGAELRALMEEQTADLIILDLMMPGEDGLSLTRYLRENFHTGILILTGKGDAIDRIVGLEMGADDYLGKPFDLRELLARVRSILRRTQPLPPAGSSETGADAEKACLTFDRFHLDLVHRRLTNETGEEVHLTSAEYDLLVAFATHPNRPLDRDQLLDAVAGRDWQPYDRSIDLHVSHLRKKIEGDPKQPSIIKTVRGAGYVFTSPVVKE